MKVLGGFILITLVISAAFFSVSSFRVRSSMTEPQTPVEVVGLFCELAEQGHFDQLRGLTTDYPKEFFVSLEADGVKLIQERGGTGVSKVRESHQGDLHAEPSGLAGSAWLVKRDAERVNRDALYIGRIDNVWVNGKEARVRVELRSKRSAAYPERADFLLYNDRDEWRVFLVDVPTPYGSYGIPATAK